MRDIFKQSKKEGNRNKMRTQDKIVVKKKRKLPGLCIEITEEERAKWHNFVKELSFKFGCKDNEGNYITVENTGLIRALVRYFHQLNEESQKEFIENFYINHWRPKI